MKRPAILLVDDREDNLLALERLLDRTDATLVKAGNGNDALKACLNHDFALALLDVNMPDMNGYELAEVMRGEQCLSRIPIIFLTAAYSREHQIFQGYSCGAVDYIIKPIQPEILLNKVNIFLDIHRQKQELLFHGQELERLNRELQQAKEAAEAATKAKSAFLAEMSHEVRNPLAGVIGVAELLLASGLTADQTKYAEILQRCGNHLLAILNDSLDLSRIEAERMRFEVIDFDLGEVIYGVILLLQNAAAAKGVLLSARMAPDIPTGLRGDPGRLRQIIMNLVGNAIRHTEKGEIVVRADLDKKDEESIRVRFEIEDSGIGISEEDLAVIFNPFMQARLTTGGNDRGTGLGLAISKKLVELFNGEIGAKSTVGSGSTFWFTVVLSKQAEATETTGRRNNDSPLSCGSPGQP